VPQPNDNVVQRTFGPGRDQPLDKDDPNLTVIQAVRNFRQEAEEAKWDRLAKNKRNRDVYLGLQDWSHKQEGQSREFIPKAPVAVEQMTSFVKKGLISFGDWFSIELDRSLSLVVDGAQIREVLKCFLKDLWMRNNVSAEFHTVLSDAVKMGLLESLIILKVHGGMMPRRKPIFKPASRATKEDEELEFEEEKVWRLRIDIVRPEDYYPDPTGNGLYEIHRVERDLHEVIEAAEEGLYDKKAVDELIGTDFKRPEDEKRKDRARNQPETTTPSFRKRVVLDEFWGTLLNDDGTVAHRNIVCTVANDKFLIRPPEPNPFWHQESPFVAAPIIRVPESVWHKALYDHGSDLNIALNELFNLILDGGLASVWGIKQLRLEDLEDPGQVAGGVRQGVTLGVKQTLPHNAKVLETVSTGNVPNDAMAVYEALNREFNNAVLTNEMKVGQLPPRRVLATEVIEVTQSQAVTLDGIVGDMESSIIKPVLRKAWLTVLQNADDIPQHAWNSIIDARVAMLIMRASPEERFALFSEKCQFKVFGLSQTLARAQDFQKSISLMQVTQMNPILARAFMMRYSGDKHLRKLMQYLNINPDDMEKDQDELAQVAQEIQQTAAIGQVMGQAGGGMSAPAGTESTPGNAGSPEAARVNQLANPLTGLTGNV
jgi:hypothetical protein